MRTNLSEKKRRIFRFLLKSFSLTSAMFVFQACYGTPQDFGHDVYLEGIVKAKKTDLPIPGIRVSLDSQPQYEFTDQAGKFRIYASKADQYKIHFTDVDALMNGSFSAKDTTVQFFSQSVSLNIVLNEQ